MRKGRGDINRRCTQGVVGDELDEEGGLQVIRSLVLGSLIERMISVMHTTCWERIGDEGVSSDKNFGQSVL